MLIMARDRGYDDLRVSVEGKRVSIWTCETCARLCYGFGGAASAERLADALRNDGVDVSDTDSVSAGCVERKLFGKEGFGKGSDVIIALTCSIGAQCAERIFGKETINPAVTYGPGFLGHDGPAAVLGGGKNILLSDMISPDDAPFIRSLRRA